LIKYIKSFLWRVAKRLSYIEEARCLKFNEVDITKWKVCKKVKQSRYRPGVAQRVPGI